MALFGLSASFMWWQAVVYQALIPCAVWLTFCTLAAIREGS